MDTETFNLVPLTIDPASKALSTTDGAFTSEIEELNKIHRTLISIDAPSTVPPPPAPVNPKRSVQINKLRESGNTAYKKSSFQEAVKMYDLAMRMALDRPSWEASGLVREELSALYNNRAQAYMSQNLWAEGAVDAETSVEMKKVANAKGWWRRGQCLKEMGRLDEALEWVRNGLDFERAGPDKQGVAQLEELEKSLVEAQRKRS